MNRKNLTAAVLAGLAGAAGIAGTAQAVNINPDGLGQVLIYPYFTSNDGNQTILSVVNTTHDAKAVKIRFLEGFNSREVLDFNIYMSHHDVWTGTVIDVEGAPNLRIDDNTCTVPYLQGGMPGDVHFEPLRKIAYSGKFNDLGPEGIERAAEGHVEIIEMGTLVNVEGVQDFADNATHTDIPIYEDPSDPDPDEIVDYYWAPEDCEQLEENWTEYTNSTPDGIWWTEAQEFNGGGSCDSDEEFDDGCAQAYTGTERNSGGLFGGASIVNVANGTMYTYDAIAIQGFDKSWDGIHYEPGTIHPSLDDGDQHTAIVFFGVPQNRARELSYERSIDAVSALFMHEHLMNEYVTNPNVAAATEWVVTFPTKSFYVDEDLLFREGRYGRYWYPDVDDPAGCFGWEADDDLPEWIDNPYPFPASSTPPFGGDWPNCDYVYEDILDGPFPPFTDTFDGKACEQVFVSIWDREERDPDDPDEPGGAKPPVVSPSVPECDPAVEVCDPIVTKTELCYEVNVIRFGDNSVFGTPTIEESSLLQTFGELPFEDGWALVDMWLDPTTKHDGHFDDRGLAGLPATGFAAVEYENAFLTGGVIAHYGGLFKHKGNVRRVYPHPAH